MLDGDGPERVFLVAVGLGLALTGWMALRPSADRAVVATDGPSRTSAPTATVASPTPPSASGSGSGHQVVATPVPIRPLIHPALPGEGLYHPAVGWIPGGSPVQIAWYRSDPANPSIRATIAWIDPSRTQLALYPGSLNPPPAPALPQGPTMVPPSARSRLIATFNSGFYLTTPYGSQPGSVAEGFAVNHRVYSPMLQGSRHPRRLHGWSGRRGPVEGRPATSARHRLRASEPADAGQPREAVTARGPDVGVGRALPE